MKQPHDTETRDLYAWAGVYLPLAMNRDRRRPEVNDDNQKMRT